MSRVAVAAPRRGRIHFVDAARALAVGLAMYAHAMKAFGAWGPKAISAMRLVPQTAPPLFIMMYGMMLEIVYAPRVERGEMATVARRFAVRGLQCYLGYAATALAALAAGRFGPDRFASALLLQHPVPYGTILLFFVFALLAAGPLLLLRRRFGVPGLLGLVAATWALRPLLAALDPVPGWLWMPLGTLVGVVGRPLGPSVLFGMTFVVAGMVVAEPLRRGAVAGLAPFLRRTAALAALAAALVAAHVLADGPGAVAGRFSAFSSYVTFYRRGDHPAYFAAGTLLASVWLVALALLLPRDRPLPRWGRAGLELGRSSLLAFTLGNVILILVRGAVAPASPAGRAGGALAFIGVLLGLLLAIAAGRRRLAAAGHHDG